MMDEMMEQLTLRVTNLAQARAVQRSREMHLAQARAVQKSMEMSSAQTKACSTT